jgi:NADH dehydrogenase
VKIIADSQHMGKTYEIGGPEQLTYTEVTRAIADALGVRRPMVHVPMFFIGPMAKVAETFLSKPPVTTDQLIMLQEDNVCDRNDIVETFGIEPVKFREGLAKFLGKTRDL